MRAPLFWSLLGALLLAHAAVNVAWLSNDLSLRSHDGGPHLEAQLQAARVLRQQGLDGVLALARPVEPGWWPSAGYLPGAALALITGEGPSRLRAIYLGYLALLLISVAGVGRRLWSPGAGLLAAAMVGWLPVVYGEGRSYGVDLPGAALLSAAAWLLLATRGFSRLWPGAALGLLLGCSVLVRPQVALFFVPLALAALVSGFMGDASRCEAGDKPHRKPVRGVLGVLLAAAVSLVVASPWWLGHLEQIARTFARHQLDAAQLSGNADATPAYYLSVLPWAFPLWLAPAVLLATWGWLRGQDRGAANRMRPVIWAWLLGGTVLVLLIKVHFMRFLLPLCPALALVTAAGLLRLRLPWMRRAAVGLVLAAGAGTWGIDSLVQETSPSHTLPPGWSAPRPHGACSGPPLVDPGMVAARRLARHLARLHPGGAGVELRMVQTPTSGRFRWVAGPMMRLELGQALVLGPSYKGRYLFDAHDPRQSHVKIGGAVMPPLAYGATRQRYLLTFEERPPELERQIDGARRFRVHFVRTALGAPRWATLWR